MRAALFYMDRDDVQLKAWYNEGPQFVGYTDNAASGSNYGLELEADWQVLDRLRLDASLGLLDTEIGNFVANDPELGFVDKDGREQAQAPNWQFRAGVELALFARLRAGRGRGQGRRPIPRTPMTSAARPTACCTSPPVTVAIASRPRPGCATRSTIIYVVHGFYFGNDPRTFYVNEAWYQYGAPRVAGVTVSWSLE